MSSLLTPCRFLLWSAAAQLIALSTIWILLDATDSLTLSLLFSSAFAVIAARVAKLPIGWQVVNGLTPFGIAVGLSGAIPSWLPLAILIVLVLFFLPAILTRVPYYPTNPEMLSIILKELPEEESFTFIDLGSGFGSLLIELAQARPHGKFFGVDTAPLPFLVSWVRSVAHPQVQVRYKSIWNVSYSDYDFVYAFLSPAPMAQLWEKAEAEMRAPQHLLINSFPCPTQATRVVETTDARNRALYIYNF